MSVITAVRGDVVTFSGDPFLQPPEECLQHLPDALVVMRDGLIQGVGPSATLLPTLPETAVIHHYPDSLISAGFIDTHVHYPQMEMIGAYGKQLLDWLNTYTFIVEQKFADSEHARSVARQFLRELLRAGTTTAMVYCTVHPQSVEAFFTESKRLNTRMIAGKVLMDRNAPPALLDTAQSAYDQSKALLERWHHEGRQLYAITPRFAPTSTEEQLCLAGVLATEHPDSYIQTHLCETPDEIAWVKELFPNQARYLQVYEQAGLVRERSVFGHGVHLCEEDFACCHAHGAALAHCPTSNMFLGSGLFKLFEARRSDRPVRVGLGTDLGAGTSFSQLQSLNEAYKVAQLSGSSLNAIQALYLATKGGAEALYLENTIGTVAVGYEADLVVLDPKATPLLNFRNERCESLEEQLFMLMTLGDDRAVQATYVAGERVHLRGQSEVDSVA